MWQVFFDISNLRKVQLSKFELKLFLSLLVVYWFCFPDYQFLGAHSNAEVLTQLFIDDKSLSIG